MSRLMTVVLMSAGLSLGACATAQRQAPVAAAPVTPITKDAHDAAIKNAEARFKADKDACATRGGNAKDICVAEASAREKVAKSDAEAAWKNTPKAREDARIARAQANHDVAKEKCDDLSGNAKDVCNKEADALLTRAKADAKVDRVAADASSDAAAKQADAQRQAADAKRDAEYKVAVEKCDALSGPAKSACVSDAKMRYGK
jgi:hypothetical protein